MKSLGFLLSTALWICPLLMAQSAAPQPAAPQSAAQVSFETIKSIAGEWEGPVTIEPAMNGVSMADIRVVLRVTSKGHAIVHELQEKDVPFWMRSEEQVAKFDHPVTMFYLDGDQLNLVHYCDAGNRPHMTAKVSPDSRKIAFDMVDISGSPMRGHMQAMAFTPIDANHHAEDWMFMMPGDKLIHVHFDLHRVN